MNYQTDKPCLVCKTVSVQRCFHHVKSRKSGGGDELWNLMPLCLEHHNQVHMSGLNHFANSYNNVRFWLLQNNWYFNLGKWRHE